jgi:5-oxoprolinase (ATP-hydrolysing) subunit A
LKELLKEQVGALAAVLLEIGAPLHHVKLHGALYHQVEEDRTLAGAYVGWMMENWPGARLLARAGGLVQLEAMAVGAPVWRELFLDRGYMADGGLLPREEPGALLDARGARRRLELFRREGKIETVEGLYLRLEGESFCLHGDSPDAATVARIASEMMGP